MSELALQLIRENKAAHARGENATYLDLGRTGLTYLPDELFDCTWLETLIVSDYYWDWQKKGWTISRNRGNSNFIEAIPVGMGQLRNLKTLHLSGNGSKLWKISDLRFLENLPQLQSLNLSLNEISDGHFLENLPQLQSLDLSYNQISDGRFLEKLTNLKELAVENNAMSECQALFSLVNLTLLYVDKKVYDNLPFIPQLIETKKIPAIKTYGYPKKNFFQSYLEFLRKDRNLRSVELSGSPTLIL
jgi:internalin A